MIKFAFYLEGIDRKVFNIDLSYPDEIIMKRSIKECIQLLEKKKKITFESYEQLSTNDGYRIYFTKKEGNFFKKRKITYIYFAKEVN
ncbi:hypothetical protein ACLIBH_13805 [Virgibacillus sp. W0430]|uniref:hypothetical protein n=1 Tax=Virgibacillus sp. W0430 TaxID=3391580 RepID=UPI003F44DDC7